MTDIHTVQPHFPFAVAKNSREKASVLCKKLLAAAGLLVTKDKSPRVQVPTVCLIQGHKFDPRSRHSLSWLCPEQRKERVMCNVSMWSV